MFWTLIKLLLFVALVIAAAFGVGQLMDSDQTIGLQIFDMEFVLGPVQAVVALLVLLFGMWLVLKLIGLAIAVLRFMTGEETALRRYFALNREKRGLDALLDAMIAQAEGDGKTATAKARKANALLDRPVLTNLLIAQAAELKGNRDLAEDSYKLLLTDNRSRFVGIQGLIRTRLDDGDKEKARKLAAKALQIQPAHEATQNTLLQLQTEAEDWAGARQTLLYKKSSGGLPRDVWRRRDAILALQEADKLAAEGDLPRAREAAIEANRLSPGLIPAAVSAAEALTAQGNGGAATRVIKKAWKVQPHPDLAAAFATIEKDETPQQRVSRFNKILRLRPDHSESKLLRAELLISAEEFPEARRALGKLYESEPTVRALTIMAAIERGEGADDTVVRGWLTRALTARRGPQWVCGKCQHVHASWVATCENCGAFDTLEWKEAPDSTGPSATQTELLPLIVGRMAETQKETPDADIVDAEATVTTPPEAEKKPA